MVKDCRGIRIKITEIREVPFDKYKGMLKNFSRIPFFEDAKCPCLRSRGKLQGITLTKYQDHVC
jgi:hypothetical protein